MHPDFERVFQEPDGGRILFPEGKSPSPPPDEGQGTYHQRPKATKKIVDRTTKMDRALELRKKGMTTYEIAVELKVTRQEAKRLVDDAFAEARRMLSISAEEAALVQNMRLEKMFASLQEKLDRGDSRAIEVAIKVLERQSKLMGLDAPEKTETMITYANLSDTELLDEAKRLKIDVKNLGENNLLLPGETTLPEILEAEVVEIFDADSGTEERNTKEAPQLQQESQEREQPQCDGLPPARSD